MRYAKPFSILALLGLALAAHAADFNADFNLTANPGTTGWTYGYTTGLGGPLTTYTSLVVNANNRIWTAPGLSGDSTPSVFKRSGPPGDGVQTGEAGLHGGPSGEFSVARWTSATAGVFNVAGKFGAGDGGTVSVYVRKGGSSLFERLSTGQDEAFGLANVSLGASESIDFVVGTAGGYFFDSTPLSATITPVPEPASLAVLGLGALGFFRRRR